MIRNFPVFVYFLLVCGVVLAVYITKGNAKSANRYGRQSDEQECALPAPQRDGDYFLFNEQNPQPGSGVPSGSKMSYMCNGGYTVHPRCTNGRWVPPIPKCSEVSSPNSAGGCNLPTSVENGRYTVRDGEILPGGSLVPYDSSIQFSCYHGYILDSLTDTFSCSRYGWFPTVRRPRCVAKPECAQNSDCPQGKACIANKCLVPCQGSCGSNAKCRKVENDRYSCVCKNGFVADSHGDCKPKVELCPPLKFQNVNVKCMFQDNEVECDKLMKPGTVATSTCKENYKLAYDPEYTQLTCHRTGHWDYPLVSCIPDEKFCPPLKYQQLNLNVKCMLQDNDVSCDSPMKPGTIATLHCNQFYQLSKGTKSSQLMCLSNGDWDNTLSRCVPVCGKSSKIGLSLRELPVALIVEGDEAKVGTFPWHAGIYYRQQENRKEIWDQKCGGSLIGDQFILTAAHCVYDREATDLRVAVGKYYRSWDRSENSEQKRNVMQILYPPGFYREALDFDIALLILDKKIELGDSVMPICSRPSDVSMDVIRNEKLYAVGWGRTGDGQSDSMSETLRYNDVKYVPPNDCHRLIPPLVSLIDKFCTLKNSSDVSIAQPGDSGGGLTMVFGGLHYIFGIVSNKIKHLSIFTNVTSETHIKWIENQIRPYDNYFSWGDH